jgi:hypothetical protein
MVSVAILALAVVPMLLTRERCYDMAIGNKVSRTLKDMAQRQLAYISLNVIRGESAGEIEDAPGFRYEYSVTIYDFGSGLEEDEEENNDSRLDTTNAPRDAVFSDEDVENVGPLMARHVVLKVFAPEEAGEEGEEFMIDTYIPILMTEEQYERMQNGGFDGG